MEIAPIMQCEIIGDSTLYCGDCREIVPTLGMVDAVITDPPYGEVETHQRHLSSVILRNGEATRQSLHFDGLSLQETIDLAQSWVCAARRWVVFTCEWKYAHALQEADILVRLGIWRKPDGAPQFTGDRPGMGWEAVAICHRPGRKYWNGGGKHAFWTWPKGQNNSGHPTGKPIGLFSDFCRDFADVGETILDPFMGSGTTGVAAIGLGRGFVGIEIQQRYFDIACERITQVYKQLPLFVQAPPQSLRQESLFS